MTPNANPNQAGGRPRRPALLLAAGLLVATAGAGAALRAGDPLPDDPAEAAAPLEFRSPGGGPVHFSGQLDRGAVLDGSDGEVRMKLVLRAGARSHEAPARLPSDLVVVLDRSGSMSGEKLAHAQAAIRALLERLGPQDRFALVTYSDFAEIPIPLAEATPAFRTAWLGMLERIHAQGGTNLASGLDLGLGAVESSRKAGRAPRVILISDGLANQGDVSREGLRGRASRASAGEYALSTIGVGADFDEELMAALADAGSGNFHYLQNAVNLAEIFSAELDTARETVASGLVIRLDPAPGVVLTNAAGYPVERGAGGGFEVRPGTLFAGQERQIFLTLRVPSSGPALQDLGEMSLTFRGDGGPARLAFTERPRIARVAQQREFLGAIDPDRWSEGVVVDAYNQLRREVAKDVKRGDAGAAREKIERYEADIRGMNEFVRSPRVAEQLLEMKELAGSVAAAAAAPASERAVEAKKLQSTALDAARPGAKK